ncbi:hypothetical protein GH733_017218 [Mirounga leonina]|nr:hypothetical protein GH733_017218 [Mirounga leonina]
MNSVTPSGGKYAFLVNTHKKCVSQGTQAFAENLNSLHTSELIQGTNHDTSVNSLNISVLPAYLNIVTGLGLSPSQPYGHLPSSKMAAPTVLQPDVCARQGTEGVATSLPSADKCARHRPLKSRPGGTALLTTPRNTEVASTGSDLPTQPGRPLPSERPGWAWPSGRRAEPAARAPKSRNAPRSSRESLAGRFRDARYREEGRSERSGSGNGWLCVAASGVCRGSGSGESGSRFSSRPVGPVKREPV